ncbi:MAG: NUDIX domain-containing protein [Desulfurococcales archaeon]|nr:NUDIX domain-containing protein [Desulfurococcales archaeon]
MTRPAFDPSPAEVRLSQWSVEGCAVSARRRAAVLVLVWGEPPRVLLVRKSCSVEGPWRCHAAFPGGHVRLGESPVEAALREAWEEAWVYPRAVRVVEVLPEETTKIGEIRVVPVLAVPSGPLCTLPRSREVDQVFWHGLDILEAPPSRIKISGRVVLGYRLRGGAVLWGLTLRILRGLRPRLLRLGLGASRGSL